MRPFVCIVLVSLCAFPLLAQGEEVGFASVNNMIETIVPEVVKSITQADSQVRTIAIWNLDAAGSQPIDMTLLEDQLTSGLVAANQFKRFVVIDHPGLQLLAAEKGLQLVDIVDRKRMREVGQALGIDAFLYGSVNLQGERLSLNLRLLDPSRAATVWAQSFEATDPVLEAKRQRAVAEAERNLRLQNLSKYRRSESSAAFRSFVLPGLGQFYVSRNSEGISFLFVEGVAGSLLLVSNIDKGADNGLNDIGLALLLANHLVSTIHAAIAANRYNVHLLDEIQGGLQMSWDASAGGPQLRYTRTF